MKPVVFRLIHVFGEQYKKQTSGCPGCLFLVIERIEWNATKGVEIT